MKKRRHTNRRPACTTKFLLFELFEYLTARLESWRLAFYTRFYTRFKPIGA